MMTRAAKTHQAGHMRPACETPVLDLVEDWLHKKIVVGS